MELTDTQLREKFQQWGKSSGVITDFAKCAPLPVSGARLYSRETNIAWQAFRDAYWSGHREAVLASIPEMGSGEQRFDARIGKLCTHRPAPAPAPALCHCYVDAPPHTHEPIPESATMQERFIAADAGCTVEEVRQAFAEPIPQDDAAVVGEMQQAYIRGTQSPMHIACTTDSCCTAGMESALAVARRGMVTLEAVEKAVRFEYAAPRLLTTADIFTHAVLARLTAPKPTKQERVEGILERHHTNLSDALYHQTPSIYRKKVAAEIVAELEAQNGK
jgi:hypothetical protein